MRGRLDFGDSFVRRHLGPRREEIDEMLEVVGIDSLDDLIEETVPATIRMKGELALGESMGERELLERLRDLARQNRICRSFIGMGYYGSITPAVIQRNILENPGWYTQYTPYQSEIAQGRLEALLNFQTMVGDLTGFELANASLLDEATAAAEAIAMLKAVQKKGAGNHIFVSSACHPQTIEVVKVRAASRGWELRVGDHRECEFESGTFAALLQYPASDGVLWEYDDFCTRAHANNTLVCVAVDLLALCLFRPPAEFGADVAVTGAPMRRFWPQNPNTDVRFLGVLLASLKMCGENWLCGWLCKPVNNTSKENGLPAIYVLLRCFPRWWPVCMRYIMVQAVWNKLPNGCINRPGLWLRVLKTGGCGSYTKSILIP